MERSFDDQFKMEELGILYEVCVLHGHSLRNDVTSPLFNLRRYYGQNKDGEPMD